MKKTAEKPKSNRGGSRSGSGRKPKGDAARIYPMTLTGAERAMIVADRLNKKACL